MHLRQHSVWYMVLFTVICCTTAGNKNKGCGRAILKPVVRNTATNQITGYFNQWKTSMLSTVRVEDPDCASDTLPIAVNVWAENSANHFQLNVATAPSIAGLVTPHGQGGGMMIVGPIAEVNTALSTVDFFGGSLGQDWIHISVNDTGGLYEKYDFGVQVVDFCVEVCPTQFQVLIGLYNSTVGPSWTDSSGWLLTDSPCINGFSSNWFGVTCENGHITEINLQNNNLNGPLPCTLFQCLPNLQRLNLHDNNISSVIPHTLRGLTCLTHLLLSKNALMGSIPTGIGSLTKLQELHLDDNSLSGVIPNTLPN
eukprot:TRINITY_DN68101_c7_g2_i1.p1 TRINITY_DN68101_c7_g2~~TRINITY_DN68101_c7_g2_i1.p1  ORF type:complete len:311 (+),score=24.41 TRINITY_DN68101_c7_g2_i1:75-1007(+)